MKTKPLNPYQRLLEEAKKYARGVAFCTRRTMWVYPKAKLSENWRLDGLAQRVEAADQLGYDVQLVSEADGLHVVYVKRPPEPYWSFKP